MTERLIQNDNLPDQEFEIYDDDGAAVNITGATINFYFTNNNTGTVVNNGHTAMTITDAVSGECKYVWDNHTPASPVDLATAGKYTAEIEVTFVSGLIETVFDTFKYYVRQELGPVAP